MRINWKWLMLFVSFSYFSITSSAQFIKDTYRFNNNLSVSAPDCGPDLIPAIATGNCSSILPTGGYFLNDTLPHCTLRRPVYHNNMNWGLKYLNTNGTIASTYT